MLAVNRVVSRRAATQLEPIPRIIRLTLLLVVFAQLADAITFALGSQMIGIGQESNGLISLLYHQGGLTAVLLLKGWAILMTVAVLMVLAPRKPRAFMVGATVALGMGLLGLLSNTVTVAGLIG
jgi:hypothetical protein